MIPRRARRMRSASISVVFLAILSIGTLFIRCDCEPDAEDIDVSPDCPNGTLAAASITIQYDLSGLSDIGVDKQVRISGDRLAGQHNCSAVFPNGSSISPAVDLSGQGSGTHVVSSLQDGNWEVRVIVTGGASTPHPAVTRTGLLAPGSTRTLVVSGDAAGGLNVTF